MGHCHDKHDSIIHARIIFSPTNTDQACGNNTPPFSSSYRTWDYATRKALVRTIVLTITLAATHVDQQEKRPRKHSGPARATALRQSPCKDTAVEAKEPDKTTEEKSGKAGARASTRPRPKSPTNQPRNTPARPFKKNGRNQRFRHTLNTVDDAVDYQAPTVRGTQRARTRRRHTAA